MSLHFNEYVLPVALLMPQLLFLICCVFVSSVEAHPLSVTKCLHDCQPLLALLLTTACVTGSNSVQLLALLIASVWFTATHCVLLFDLER
jgi:small-conductance mechanosensitive channel